MREMELFLLKALNYLSPYSKPDDLKWLVNPIMTFLIMTTATIIQGMLYTHPHLVSLIMVTLILYWISLKGSRHTLGTLMMTYAFISLFFFYKPLTDTQHYLIATNSQTFNLMMITLNLFISALMLMLSMKLMHSRKLMFSISTLMMIVSVFFLTNWLLSFYIFFELSLIPTMYIIMKWGYQPERLIATIYFTIYTVCASLPLLVVILKLRLSKGMADLNPLMNDFMLPHEATNLMLICFLVAFLVKLPTWGLHLWLPKAHLQAPLAGSMILAGILLKLGGYGIMKIAMIFSALKSVIWEMVFTINLYGSLLVGLICLSTIDMKKMIAYSSIIHMNLMVLGITTMTTMGTMGAKMMMIAHGISSPGMFSLANTNYEKTKTRNLTFNKIFLSQPPMMLMWFILCSSNMAAPPSLSLMSEILITTSAINSSLAMMIPLGIITFLSAAYNLYLYSSQLANKPRAQTNKKRKDYSVEFLGGVAQSLPPFLLISITFMF